MLTQCLGSQVAPGAARFARAHRTASARARRGLHFCQVAARGRAGRFTPLGPGPQWGPFRTDRSGRRDARFARAHRTASARARPSAWVLNSRRVAARDNSRQWAAAERRACASRWNATAPETGAGLFPDFRGRKLAGHGAERCEVKRCGIQAANVSMAVVPALCRPLSENRPGPCLWAGPGMTTALALFSRLCRLRP